MKFNPLVILAGGCMAGLLAITPFIAQANSAGSLAGSLAQAASPAASADRPLQQAFERLNLTPAQQTQFSSLRRDTRTQMQAILQPAQRQQFLTSWQQGSSFRDSITAMNLAEGQRQQMRELFQSTRAQARALLTESQRQELRQMLQERLDNAF